MRWTTATAIVLAIGAIGVATRNGTLLLTPLVVLLAIGLVQEWINANAHQQETKNIEEVSSERGATVVAGYFHSRGDASLERVIDPLTKPNEQRTEADKNGGFVFHAFEINGHRYKQENDTCHRNGLVPIVDDDRLERVGHGEVANAQVTGRSVSDGPVD